LLAADHKDFNDVNKALANVDILIYTLTISAGCSFEVKQFTWVFGYFSSMSTDYKTAIQMLGHVRNVLTREYHIFINSRSHDLPIHKEEVKEPCCSKSWQRFSLKLAHPMNTAPHIEAGFGHIAIIVLDLSKHLLIET